MSWTTLATIRKHLSDAEVASTTIENQEQVLIGTDQVQLLHKSLTTASEEVKSIDLASPHSAGGLSLSGVSWLNLAHANLVPETVVVAADQALETVYVEGSDYVVDYENGKIKRVSGSSIPDETTSYIWYFYFTIHTKDTDYEIDYSGGKLNRIAIGAIPDGATVFVDYTTSAGTVTDDLINQAITEAEDKILARLQEDYSASSTDQGLKTGATELSLTIVCNAKAMDMMLKLPSDESDGAARQWAELSRRYERQAWKTLDRFLQPRAWRGAQAISNQSWQHYQQESDAVGS
ncbi:hypothetical protein KKA08_03345 [bacterium]|nr:hypothetical protein [bacterium]